MEPRALTQTERASLLRLLPEDAFPGVAEYRTQVDHVTVVGRCSCGCPTVELEVDRTRAAQSPALGAPLLPLEGEAGNGDAFVQLIVFAPRGWLESLELVYYSDTPPAELPDPDSWRVVPGSSGGA